MRVQCVELNSVCVYMHVCVCVQCVELDFHYPSEGIHKRWDAGYRITCAAATHDQSAFILSQMRRSSQDETQETLRTSQFPTTHIKDKWDNDLYLIGIAFGKTVS